MYVPAWATLLRGVRGFTSFWDYCEPYWRDRTRTGAFLGIDPNCSTSELHTNLRELPSACIGQDAYHTSFVRTNILPMSLEWHRPTHELVLKTLGARVSTQVANLIMPVLSRRASSTSATVTEAWWCTDSTLTTLPYVAPYSFFTIFFGDRNHHRHLKERNIS